MKFIKVTLIWQKLATFTAATTLIAGRPAEAQTWETILPDANFAPQSYGSALLIEPFSDSAPPAVFVGTWESPQGSLLYVDPAAGLKTVVDNDLQRVLALGYKLSSGTAPATLYAVGYRPRSARDNTPVWKVRQSTSGRSLGSWSDSDTFSPSKASANAKGITTDDFENVYVCGFANNTGASASWVVRKLAAGPGAAWTTVCDLKSKGDRSANAACFFPGNSLNPTPAILIAGILNNKWTVLRTQDQGTTWQSVDTWSPGNIAATASAITCDSQGLIYVVGHRATWVSPKGWVIRKSEDGGNSWNPEPELDVAEGAASWAASVATDQLGNVWVGGMTQNADRQPRWTIVQKSPQQTWLEAWAFRQLPFEETQFWFSKNYGIATDALGKIVYATGGLDDGNAAYVGLQWLVPPPPPEEIH